MEPRGQVNDISLARGIAVGVFASLVGTIIMDLAMVVQFSMMGLPALTYLAMIGSIFGGGVPVGMLVHIVTTVILGVIFSVPVLTVDALRIDTVRKGVVIGFLAGVLSIGACVPVSFLMRETVATVLSFMLIPHLVWGTVVGIIAGYGMRSTPAA